MSISDRILIILEEKELNQSKFAESIYVTKGYVSRLLKNAIGMSNSTAMLIERVHGYAKNWVLHGQEPKMVPNTAPRDLSPVQKRLIAEIETMTDDELFFIVTYIEAFKRKKELDRRKGNSPNEEN
jgi:transcriptional regulator with XRE-family HTH domain